MNSSVVSKANKFLLIALGALAFAVIIALSSKAAKRAQTLKKELHNNHVQAENCFVFKAFTEKEYGKAKDKALIKINDLIRISDSDYRRLHISMWDIDYLDPDWYNVYYASPIVYGKYGIKTPQEVCNYLSTSIRANSELDTVYLSVDPYELYKNYYTSVYYDSEILTFEEYLENNLFPIFKENKNVTFKFFFPIKPLSEWANESDEEIRTTFKNWYTFLMYLRLYPNVKSYYMGNEEWLVSNNENYEEGLRFKDEIGRLVHLYMYDKNDYKVTPPEIDWDLKALYGMAYKERNGDYDYKGFENKKIVFLGDSVLDYAMQNTVSIPGFVSEMTNAPCYNLAVGGTTASEVDEDSFTNVVKGFSKGIAHGRDANRFFEDVNKDDEIIFIIEYGLNDYFMGNDIFDFSAGLKNGIDLLKKNYPNCRIMLVAPYRLGILDGGDFAYTEDGYFLSEYVETINYLSQEENVAFLNLFTDSGITYENSADFLTDEIHPKYNTNLYLARMIVESMVEQNVCGN